ncbi:DUF3472 domain-containing protein [Mucilaginibacter sp. BT774]|uniref:DUF3472 domain-containing protein n=1 Tax=Mucilaginibacter sp. BT774 TaxID=3062276 RepID=UPI002674675D|nr:DUF3472 domain-containing protein [Mucilaginibacter sp. BT774]MDO3627827.1 DUF3472 domain-containing protein [Mucilaginibacter sp. BT774]
MALLRYKGIRQYIYTIMICAVGTLPSFGRDAIHRVSTKIDTLTTVPIGGNAWRTDNDTAGGNISENGIVHWSNPNAAYTAYFRLGSTGKFKLYLNMQVRAGKSKITITALGLTRRVSAPAGSFHDVYVGEWNAVDTGYVAVKIKGESKTDSLFADIRNLKLQGTAINAKTTFVKNNEGEFFYWGRRGPSVHLGYTAADGVSAEWFYNEVTVPKGNDVIGSYFMADGFGEGYFGMQVNSPGERHILFSIWSPFNTDDPNAIPDNQKIVMLKKGNNVHTGEFGNEGAGGQSYLNYMWHAGQTYKFLVHAKPDGKGRTEYTAYFFAPELNKWQLIASFSRPKTDTYLKHLHSFLENFEPEQGTKTREVLFNNQWICDRNGNWTELTKARFTGDNTAVKGYRMDYAGGLEGNHFFLKNCGFFNYYTPRNIYFNRPASGKKPAVDLSKLP